MSFRAVDLELLEIIEKHKNIEITELFKLSKSTPTKEDFLMEIENMVDGGYIKKQDNQIIFIKDTYIL